MSLLSPFSRTVVETATPLIHEHLKKAMPNLTKEHGHIRPRLLNNEKTVSLHPFLQVNVIFTCQLPSHLQSLPRWGAPQESPRGSLQESVCVHQKCNGFSFINRSDPFRIYKWHNISSATRQHPVQSYAAGTPLVALETFLEVLLFLASVL